MNWAVCMQTELIKQQLIPQERDNHWLIKAPSTLKLLALHIKIPWSPACKVMSVKTVEVEDLDFNVCKALLLMAARSLL